MKQYIIKAKLLLLIVIIGAMSSCKGFLDIDNPSRVTEEFYNTLEGQNRLITDLYSKYRNVYSTGELQYYGTDMYMAITESPNEKMFGGYDKTFNSTAGVVGPYWSNLYKIAQEANILLNRCTPAIAGKDYESMTTQARILRAMAYYYLVETFGPVPMLTQESEELILSATRTSEEDIYKFLVDELEAAKDVLPMKASAVGRLSNGALLQLLGKVYLTRGYKSFAVDTDFENAAECFDALILDSDKTYTLLDKYASVFDENNQANAEVIWAIQYGADKNYIGNGNPQHTLFGFNITALKPDLFEKVQTDYSAMQRGYWIIPQIHEWFTDPVIDTRYDVTFKREFVVNNPASEDFGKLGLYFPRWNDASGIDKGALNTYPFKDGDKYNWYPQSSSLDVLAAGTDWTPMVHKFKDTKIKWGGKGTREDIVMRMGDTYLLCAEAYLGAGNEPLALERLNAVRERAAVSDQDKLTMKLQAIDLDVILDERGRELLGEHDRWFDLKRTGKLIERATKYNVFVAHYKNINKNHLVRPIAQDERNKVEGLTQNDGY